jgi:hypothetical protein
MIEAGRSRTYINGMIGKIKRMFRWAVVEERVPATVYRALAAVAGLRAGHAVARETAPVQPVPESAISSQRIGKAAIQLVVLSGGDIGVTS